MKILLLILAITLSLNANNTLEHFFNKITKPVKASEISLKNSDDEIVNLSDFKGKTVILNFWATWCPPCKKEMPSLQKFYSLLKDKNITVLAIAVGQDDNSVFPFINSISPTPTFPILFDTNGAIARVWGITAMPTTIIINKYGYITHYALGAREFDNKQFIDAIVSFHKKSQSD